MYFALSGNPVSVLASILNKELLISFENARLCFDKGTGNPLQSVFYSCLENSMGRGTWQVTVPGVPKSQTQLSH